MNKQIQLSQWYEQNGVHYIFDDRHRGTNAIVRGDVFKLSQLVHCLGSAYQNEGLYRFGEIEKILQEVLATGKAQTNEPICFGDDRIRLIRRLDDEVYGLIKDGPLSKSRDHLEITHNEQYGGKWPIESNSPNSFNDGSRATMIYKVMTALESMKE